MFFCMPENFGDGKIRNGDSLEDMDDYQRFFLVKIIQRTGDGTAQSGTKKASDIEKATAVVPHERLLRRGLCFPPSVNRDIGWWSQLQMFFQHSWKKFGRGDFPNVCEQAHESIPR